MRFFFHWTSYGKRCVHVCYVKHLFNYVVQSRAIVTQNLLGIFIGLPHLNFHVWVIKDISVVIDRSRPHQISLVIMTNLTRNVDCVAVGRGSLSQNSRKSIKTKLTPKKIKTTIATWIVRSLTSLRCPERGTLLVNSSLSITTTPAQASRWIPEPGLKIKAHRRPQGETPLPTG